MVDGLRLTAGGHLPNLLRGSNDYNHLAYGVHAHDMRAAEHGGRDGGRLRPVAPGRVAIAAGGAQEGLARGPRDDRPAERGGNLRKPRQHTIAVLRTFGKPNP